MTTTATNGIATEPATSDPADLLAALAAVTPATLAMLDEQIEAAERKAQSLRAVRRLVDITLNGQAKPGPKKPKAEKKTGGVGPDPLGHRRRAGEFLLHAGIARSTKIAQECNIPPGSITTVLNHEWFEKKGDQGWGLTDEGKQHFG